ncbi:OB-fold-containig protein [Actibacterium sp. 188UL27-1]|uniref:OB-fold-containig protein n=1 Tax=Actibacterium sp. 188UL27-1 TaxID=2786961 RepID=UPI00351C9AF3
MVTVGTARQGKPAQVRFRDGHGNSHYTIAEPLDPKDELPQGTEVLLLKIKGGRRALSLFPSLHHQFQTRSNQRLSFSYPF